MTTLQQEQMIWCPVARLRPSPHNPRGPVSQSDPSVIALAQSIGESGILQPLICTPDGMVLVGHRRLAAAQLRGLESVPVVIRRAETETEIVCIQIAENVQREALTLVQEAVAYRRLREMGLGVSAIAREVGVPSQRIAERLLVLELDETVQELLVRQELPVSLIRTLAKVTDPAQQRQLAMLSAKRLLSAAEIKETVREHAPALSKPVAKAAPVPVTAGRGEALGKLAEWQGRQVSADKLHSAFDGLCAVCEDCGMSKMAIICQACALPKFILRVLK